ncbi:MAG: EamA family transporter RarD [Maricaulaceae bacterium]
MNSAPHTQPDDGHRRAFMAGLAAYIIWGIFPLYFKVIEAAGAVEILSHRIIWSVPFALLLILARRQIGDLIRAIKTPKVLGLLALSSLMIAINWGLYIWAVNNGFILQASLGYYINPLMYVIVGVAAFGEKLQKLQIFAVLLAAIGVAILTFYGGVFPWISLILASSFTAYGVIRKQVEVGSIPGLLIETVFLILPALLYLHHIWGQEEIIFGSETNITVWLLAAGPITVLPLLAFTVAARGLKLSTLGILQYIAPTMQFMCALYLGETFTLAHALCFGCIWTAVALFSFNALKRPKPIRA